jgi:DNA-binding response OmpR family regulator
VTRVLLVESDRLLASNLQNFLQKFEFDVDWQYDLQDAIDCADQACPDVVVLDLLLCGRSGVEFLYEFRSYPDWQEVPVIIFSNISPRDLGGTTAGFEQLNVAAYHNKSTTSLAQLTDTIKFLLAQPVTA